MSQNSTSISIDEQVEALGASALIIQNSKTKQYLRTWTSQNPLLYIRNANLLVPETGKHLTKDSDSKDSLDDFNNIVNNTNGQSFQGGRLSTVKRTKLLNLASEWNLVAVVSGFPHPTSAELFAKASKIRKVRPFGRGAQRKPRISIEVEQVLPTFEARQSFIDPDIKQYLEELQNLKLMDAPIVNFLYTLWYTDVIDKNSNLQLTWFSYSYYRQVVMTAYPNNISVQYLDLPRQLFYLSELETQPWFQKRLSVNGGPYVSSDHLASQTRGFIDDSYV